MPHKWEWEDYLLPMYILENLKWKDKSAKPSINGRYKNILKNFFSDASVRGLVTILKENQLRELIRIWKNDYSISSGDASIMLIFMMNCGIDIDGIMDPDELDNLVPSFNDIYNKLYYIGDKE